MVRRPPAAERRLPLARGDGKLTDATVTLRQDRHFLVGDERVTLSVSCANSEGPKACQIDAATAFVPPAERDAARWPKVPVVFAAGAEGAFASVFAPAASGFAG